MPHPRGELNARCRECRERFHVSRWRIVRQGGAVFCSHECRRAHFNRRHERCCLVCGINYLARAGTRDAKHPVCSRFCAMRYRESNPIGGRFHRMSKDLTCKSCGKVFQPLGTKPRYYCSWACQANASRKRPFPHDGKAYTLECTHCGQKFTRQTKQFSRWKNRRFFCSLKCKRSGLSGANSPVWRGGNSRRDRGPDWPDMSAAARERDDHKCQVCGKPERKGQKLDVDHIVPFRLVLRNDLINLLSVCKAPCHVTKTNTAEAAFLRGDILTCRQKLNANGWPMERVEAAIKWWGTL